MSDEEEFDIEGMTYGLAMPLVVCKSKDGPYDDESFVAGVYLGEASAALKLTPFGLEFKRYVPTPLVPQLDLLAMNEGCHLRATAWEDHPDEWSLVEISRVPFEDEAPDA